jgi:hypothetical protein
MLRQVTLQEQGNREPSLPPNLDWSLDLSFLEPADFQVEDWFELSEDLVSADSARARKPDAKLAFCQADNFGLQTQDSPGTPFPFPRSLLLWPRRPVISAAVTLTL